MAKGGRRKEEERERPSHYPPYHSSAVCRTFLSSPPSTLPLSSCPIILLPFPTHSAPIFPTFFSPTPFYTRDRWVKGDNRQVKRGSIFSGFGVWVGQVFITVAKFFCLSFLPSLRAFFLGRVNRARILRRIKRDGEGGDAREEEREFFIK